MQPDDKLRPTTVDWLVLIGIDSGVPIATIWQFHTGEASSTVALASGFIVLLVANFFALRTVRGRYERDGKPLPRTLLTGAVALAIVSCLITIVGVLSVRQQNSYLNLAMSDKPLSSIEPEQRRLVVELIRRTAANSQEENKAMAEALKVPMKPSVYSPESFANSQSIQSTVAALTKLVSIDFQYFASQQSARQDFRQKMAVCDEQYLRQWEAERQEQEAAEKATDLLEHKWFASIESLYGYALKHTGQIAAKDGHIVITSDDVREAFSNEFNRSEALHHDLLSSEQELAKRQQVAVRTVASQVSEMPTIRPNEFAAMLNRCQKGQTERFANQQISFFTPSSVMLPRT
jgi:hypothetical protein